MDVASVIGQIALAHDRALSERLRPVAVRLGDLQYEGMRAEAMALDYGAPEEPNEVEMIFDLRIERVESQRTAPTLRPASSRQPCAH